MTSRLPAVGGDIASPGGRRDERVSTNVGFLVQCDGQAAGRGKIQRYRLQPDHRAEFQQTDGYLQLKTALGAGWQQAARAA